MKFCKYCGKIITKEKEGKNNYYHHRCKRCYNRVNMEEFNKKKWKKLGGVKPKPYFKGKGMTSGIMNQKTCYRITKIIELSKFKVGKGNKVVIYEGKDNFYHIQIFNSKYGEEKWWKFKSYSQVEIFLKEIKGCVWKKL